MITVQEIYSKHHLKDPTAFESQAMTELAKASFYVNEDYRLADLANRRRTGKSTRVAINAVANMLNGIKTLILVSSEEQKQLMVLQCLKFTRGFASIVSYDHKRSNGKVSAKEYKDGKSRDIGEIIVSIPSRGMNFDNFTEILSDLS